jgi:hypothetical protein
VIHLASRRGNSGKLEPDRQRRTHHGEDVAHQRHPETCPEDDVEHDAAHGPDRESDPGPNQADKHRSPIGLRHELRQGMLETELGAYATRVEVDDLDDPAALNSEDLKRHELEVGRLGRAEVDRYCRLQVCCRGDETDLSWWCLLTGGFDERLTRIRPERNRRVCNPHILCQDIANSTSPS